MNDSRAIGKGSMIAGKYKLLEKIGRGTFGQVFKVQNVKNGELLAAKIETKTANNDGLIVREIKILKELHNYEGFPKLIFYGKDDYHNYLIQTLCWSNLEELLTKCKRKFSIRTISHIAIQLLERIEILHSKKFIHRDLKPENIVIGKYKTNEIILIDFGLSKYYIDKQGKHIPFMTGKGLVGTARYASINAMKGNEQGRKDDLESIGYILQYFVNGSLPWINLTSQSQEDKQQRILEAKEQFIKNPNVNGLEQIQKYFTYVNTINFDGECDYQYLKSLFYDECTENNKLDWQYMEEYRGTQDDITSLQKITDYKQELDNSRLNKFLGVPNRNQDLNVTVSVNSSRANNYQNSLQRSYGNLMFLGSNRQFDEIKLGTNQSLSISQSPKERFLQFLFDDQFNDLDICQDDEPNIQMKKPRSLKKKKPSFQQSK